MVAEWGMKRISTHAPHAGRNFRFRMKSWLNTISTHAPHAGRNNMIQCCKCGLFISTHAPHAGRNRIDFVLRAAWVHFNSRAPCGAQRRHLVHHLRLPQHVADYAFCIHLETRNHWKNRPFAIKYRANLPTFSSSVQVRLS